MRALPRQTPKGGLSWLGWMSNWQYVNVVPTLTWRSAMTLNRELRLKKIRSTYYLSSLPVEEYSGLGNSLTKIHQGRSASTVDLSSKIGRMSGQYELSLNAVAIKDLAITFSNEQGDQLVAGFDQGKNEWYIDRTKSGTVDFEKGFAKKFFGPRISTAKSMTLKLVMDVSSIELFADDGLTVLTAVCFPNTPYNRIALSSPSAIDLKDVQYTALNSIW